MDKINIYNYRSVLEIPRIDDKQIVYTFEFVNDLLGTVFYKDLKDGEEYEGKFFLKADVNQSEVLIHFNCNGCGFSNSINTNDDYPEQILSFDDFIDKLTMPYGIETMRKGK